MDMHDDYHMVWQLMTDWWFEFVDLSVWILSLFSVQVERKGKPFWSQNSSFEVTNRNVHLYICVVGTIVVTYFCHIASKAQMHKRRWCVYCFFNQEHFALNLLRNDYRDHVRKTIQIRIFGYPITVWWILMHR